MRGRPSLVLLLLFPSLKGEGKKDTDMPSLKPDAKIHVDKNMFRNTMFPEQSTETDGGKPVLLLLIIIIIVIVIVIVIVITTILPSGNLT